MNAILDREASVTRKHTLPVAGPSVEPQAVPVGLIVLKQARQPMADRYPEVQAVLRDAQELTQQQSRTRLEARPAGEQPLPYDND